ncbi:10746_t:CDS:2 [Racocetra fulgida]|uniref:10746_t:CDS:1 n=1 Tax=Racocetra fulgida TaxID=60492 RepID=A0A9N9ARM9_9GLOM|nr:10746_t:CDS:2 [Racocetra fulgida]
MSHLILSIYLVAEVFSTTFRAYSAKKFPGMTGTVRKEQQWLYRYIISESSLQGIKIPIRKELRYRRVSDDLPDQTNEITIPSTSYAASNNVPNDVESDVQEDHFVEKQDPSEDYIDVLSDTAQENKGNFTGIWQRMPK